MTPRGKKITALLLLAVGAIVLVLCITTLPGEADRAVLREILARDAAATVSRRTFHLSGRHLFVFRYAVTSPNTGVTAAVWQAVPHNTVIFE